MSVWQLFRENLSTNSPVRQNWTKPGCEPELLKLSDRKKRVKLNNLHPYILTKLIAEYI